MKKKGERALVGSGLIINDDLFIYFAETVDRLTEMCMCATRK